MKLPWLLLIGFVPAVCSTVHSAEYATNSLEQRFKCERYSAEGGVLYTSSGKNSYCNNLVLSVLVDSKDWVWVGTQNGLAVYDGNQWTNRTLKIVRAPLAARALLGFMGVSECGPRHIVEGPPGTIWLDAAWRVRDGRYEEIDPGSVGYVLSTAADQSGSLWVVCKQFAYKYDGRSWTTVLCPYIGKPASVEAPGLYGIAIDAQEHIWIGGTVYGKPEAPWEHDGPVWVVDQEHKKRGGGPPMAPLFEFDGKRWRAFGSPHGLSTRKFNRAIPELNGHGQVVAKTGEGYYMHEEETWKPARDVDISAGKSWVLRERRRGLLPGHAELLFRDGERLVEVKPTDHKTGEVLDLGLEQLVALSMAEDQTRGCVWLGTEHGLYRIWLEKLQQ
jgi:hypothetical protein